MPEAARELFEQSTEGDWSTEQIGGRLYVRIPSESGGPNLGDIPLIASARELSEIVANLHYEYSIQETSRGWYLHESEDGELHEVADLIDADGWYDGAACADYVKWLNANVEPKYQMVRKLVSSQEVMK